MSKQKTDKYITDFISGQQVKATSEEVDAVQVFSKQLVSEIGGKVIFEEIPNIPRYRQRIEDIGKFKRKDLKPTHNLKATFKAIRNHLAANIIGATRDEILAQQLINLIFLKLEVLVNY